MQILQITNYRSMQGHFDTYYSAALGTKQLTTLWLNMGLMRDKWR